MTTDAIKKPKRRRSKKSRAWKDDFFARCYEYARAGLSDTKIAATIGVSIPTLRKWKEERPALRNAINRGRRQHNSGEDSSFREYVYQRLAPDTQALWDEINSVDREENGVLKIQRMMEQTGKLQRQQLYLFALTASNFNKSEALRKTCLPKRTVDFWSETDPTFAELVDEIHWHKKNFFEGALVNLVKEGDRLATIFANKTINRDRGYNDKQEIEVSGTVQHDHNHFISIEDLTLPLEVRQQILAAYREQKQERTIDVKPRIQ